ncbi:MAG: DMT family transporter [Spirochaetes bacterium]|nr:DMT family transporter [Spirochaetota bacterium]
MYKGIFYMSVSAILFAASAGVSKYINNMSDINPMQITFVRFAIGAVFAFYLMLRLKIPFRPVNLKFVFLRVIFNTVAVIFFFIGIQHTTLTEANMLNMTYPAFVFLLSPFINNEHIKKEYIFYLLFSMCAIVLILNPSLNGFNYGNVLSLISGIIAGAGVCVLRESRKYDSSIVILFYLMAAGGVLNFLMMIPYFKNVNHYIWLMAIISGSLGVAGQFAITFGAKYISAAAGSIVSTTRIFWAALMGIIFFTEILKWNTVVGGIMLFISVVGIGGGWHALIQNFRGKAA